MRPVESINQTKGDFRPHVIAIRRGTKLEFSTSDEKAMFKATGSESFTKQLTFGSKETHTPDTIGVLTITSDLDPATRSYVHVFPRDDFAVSRSNGEFKISAIHSGKYKLILWHPGWNLADKDKFIPTPPITAEVEVEIAQDKGALVEWTLPGK
jgi:hypothetical protein